VLGTAAQLVTVACLSQKALSLNGGVLNAKESSDLILAAIGLLNIKMAMIACFAMLMFVIFMISFIRNKCDSKKFVSLKGSTTFNIWALIYETIETSTIDTVFKLVCSAPSDRKPRERPLHDSHSKCSGSASLAFSNLPSVQAQGVTQVLTRGSSEPERGQESNKLSCVNHMETLETIFVNLCGYEFQASHCSICYVLNVD
jgi:hypothetical protein